MTGAPIIVVGGGLFGGLLAFHLARVRPEWPLLLLEQGDHLGGNHTWSFHESDVAGQISEQMSDSLRDLVSQTWEGTEVSFPALQRRLSGRYHSIRSEDFATRVGRALGAQVRLNCEVIEIASQSVRLRSGETLPASFCIDARGFSSASFGEGECGFQKFTGLDVKLQAPHGLSRPLLMDATCAQTDGFRFFYFLPWDEKRLLIEDTRYSASPILQPELDEQEIFTEIARRGWKVAEIERRETGVLPIPYFESVPTSPQVVGVRAGDFHEVTGYSLASAVSLVDRLGAIRATPGSAAFVGEWEQTVRAWRSSRRSQSAFFRFLNRMLFFAAVPENRYLVLQRFYSLSEPLIQRFYAGKMTAFDRFRVLAGRPPVPVLRALPCVRETWTRRARPRLGLPSEASRSAPLSRSPSSQEHSS